MLLNSLLKSTVVGNEYIFCLPMVEEELPQKAATVHDQEVGHTIAKAQSQQHIREPIERKS